jgi:hypothetical protein
MQLLENVMRAARETQPPPEALRPDPAVLKKVHGLVRHKGMIAAIEPESGDFFFGESLLAAFDRARERYPHGVFYFVRIGYPTAHVHHGGPRRVSR